MIIDLVVGLLASMWITALAAKLRDRADVKRGVEVVFGPRFASLAPVVPIAEAGLAVALITPLHGVTSLGLIGSVLSLLLLSGFTIAHARLAPTETCACFGPGSLSSRGRHIGFNIGVAALSVVALVVQTMAPDASARLFGVLLGLAIAVPVLVVRPIWIDLRRAET
jgi:hypothetical protein